jgi:hypothetical protein
MAAEGMIREAAATPESFEVLIDSWSLEAVEDSFTEGEIGRSQLVNDGGSRGPFKSPDEVIKYFTTFTDAPKDRKAWQAFEDGRLICSWHGNENGHEVSSSQIEQWKKGEIKGYSITLNVYLKFAKVWEPTPKEISRVFKVSAY